MSDNHFSPADALASLQSPEFEGLHIITGPRFAGKSTLCASLIETARTHQRTVGGILCPAIFTNGTKTGIGIRNVATGEERQMGSATPAPAFDKPVGRWFFDTSALMWGNTVLEQSPGFDVLIIDELGPLELEEGKGFSAGLDLLDNEQFKAAFVVVRPELLAVAQNRWPDAAVITVNGDAA